MGTKQTKPKTCDCEEKRIKDYQDCVEKHTFAPNKARKCFEEAEKEFQRCKSNVYQEKVQ
jgi:hypothetical protein